MIPRLSAELCNELPELKGFSERNIKSMLAFYRDYPNRSEFVQQAVAQSRFVQAATELSKAFGRQCAAVAAEHANEPERFGLGEIR